MQVKTVYVADDGKEFKTSEEALRYEESEKYKHDKKAKGWLGSYSGQRLLKKHSLDEEGLWTVYGEDPNCDFGGYHHRPKLGVYQGKLSDIVQLAVTLSDFYTHGAGGDIEKVEVTKVNYK